MERITAAREASQPIREKTGGSTFKNPPGEKAWVLIDRAGCRGLVFGDAQVSPMHCNFFINRGAATAADIESRWARKSAAGCGRRAASSSSGRSSGSGSGGLAPLSAEALFHARRPLVNASLTPSR